MLNCFFLLHLQGVSDYMIRNITKILKGCPTLAENKPANLIQVMLA